MELTKMPFELKELKIEVTHDCKLQCIHCSSVAESNTGRVMEWSSCARILDDAAAMGVEEVSFSGGEPLLWPHLQEAVSRASKHGMKVYLYSSGNAPYAKKKLRNLRSAGLNRVMFSIFGKNSQQHEKITGCKGSYRNTLETAKQCVKDDIETEFHFVPFSYNYKELPVIAKKARRLGIERISVLRLVPQGRGRKEKDGQLSHSQNLELRKIIKKLRFDGYDIRLGSPYNFLMLRENPQCRSGIDRMTIGPDLRIFPCDAFKHIAPEEVGASNEFSNLRDYSLYECWRNSPYFGVVREYLTTEFEIECKICKKLKACLSGCMAQKFYAYGELKKCPDPMCLLGAATENQIIRSKNRHFFSN